MRKYSMIIMKKLQQQQREWEFYNIDSTTTKKKNQFFFILADESIPFHSVHSFIHMNYIYPAGHSFFFVETITKTVKLCVWTRLFFLSPDFHFGRVYFPSSAHTQLASFFFHNLGFFFYGKKMGFTRIMMKKKIVKCDWIFVAHTHTVYDFDIYKCVWHILKYIFQSGKKIIIPFQIFCT